MPLQTHSVQKNKLHKRICFENALRSSNGLLSSLSCCSCFLNTSQKRLFKVFSALILKAFQKTLKIKKKRFFHGELKIFSKKNHCSPWIFVFNVFETLQNNHLFLGAFLCLLLQKIVRAFDNYQRHLKNPKTLLQLLTLLLNPTFL